MQLTPAPSPIQGLWGSCTSGCSYCAAAVTAHFLLLHFMGIRVAQGPTRGEETERVGVRAAQGPANQDSWQPTSWPAARGPKNPGSGPETQRVSKLGTLPSVLHRGPHEVGVPSERASATHKDPHITKKMKTLTTTAESAVRHGTRVRQHTAHSVWGGGGHGCAAPLALDSGRSPTVKA